MASARAVPQLGASPGHSLIAGGAGAREQMLHSSVSVGSRRWQRPSSVTLCLRDPAALLVPQSPHPLQPQVPRGAGRYKGRRHGTLDLLWHSLTTHCSGCAALSLEGPGCQDRKTASSCNWCSVTQELETSAWAASTNSFLFAVPQPEWKVRCPRGGCPLTHPQQSPGYEKAEPWGPGDCKPSRRLYVIALSLPES